VKKPGPAEKQPETAKEPGPEKKAEPKEEPEPPPVPAKSSVDEKPASPPKELTPEEKDRALRREQLDVALGLAKAFPESDDALYLVGLIYNEQGNSVEAVTYWERAVALDPTRADVYEHLGHAALLKQDNEKAAGYFLRAITLNPSLDDAYVNLARAYIGQGEMREAVSIIEKRKSTTPLAYRTLGQAYQHLRKDEKAKENYEAALKLKPDFAEAYYGLAAVCRRLGESEKAEEYLAKFNELKAEAQRTGRRVRSIWDPLAITRRNVAKTHTDAGRVFRARGSSVRAEKLWLRAAELDPKNVACRLYLGELYVRTGKDRQALAMYEEAIAIQPKDPFSYLNAGNLYVRLKRFKEAERALKKVVQLAPHRSEGYFSLARLYVIMGRNVDQAVVHAETAVELAPRAPNYAILSQACAKNGNHEGALRAIARAVELAPNDKRYRDMQEKLQKGE
jgi:tetratricopeptide (TPR) repeat protein